MNLKASVCTILLFSARLLLAQPEVTAWDVLKTGLDDKNPERRRQAVTAIGSIGLDPEAIKQVEHGLRDDDSLVRQTAAAELGQMKATASIPALKAALEDPAGEVQFTAARALWDMGDRGGEAVLQEVMTGQQKTKEGFVEGAVRDARRTMHDKGKLIRMGVKETSGLLLGPFSMGITMAEDMMKDGGATGRALAATMLAGKCDSRNLELLEWTLINEKNNTVKAAVAKSLGKCGKKDDIPRLEQFLSSSNDPLKFMSAAAIIKLHQMQ